MTSGTGTCSVYYNQAGNASYNPASQVTSNTTAQKANANVSVNGYSGVYDGAAHGATGSATGALGENLNGLLDLGASFTDVPGGTANWTFAGDANHNSASGSVAITISKANATINVSGYTGVYDGAAHGATGSATGVGGADLSDGLDLGDSFTNVPGGTANWSFSGGTNYNDANGSVAISISKADATIDVDGYSGTYDGAAHGATGSATGVLGESLSGLDLGSSFTNVPGGTANWTFTDVTGNYNNDAGSVAISISKAPLSVTADNQTIVFGQSLPTFTFQYSGFVNGETSSVIDTAPTCGVGSIPMFGNYPIVCSGGSDNNYSFTYVNGTLTVQAWTFKGFFQPVDMSGVLNAVKGGSTVPLKFEVFSGTTELTVTSVIKSFTQTKVACDGTAPVDEIELVTTGGTSLRYDATAGQFVQNWQTPKQPGQCYRATMTTQDGSTLSALFKLK
jgi:hypothetical protein